MNILSVPSTRKGMPLSTLLFSMSLHFHFFQKVKLTRLSLYFHHVWFRRCFCLLITGLCCLLITGLCCLLETGLCCLLITRLCCLLITGLCCLLL